MFTHRWSGVHRPGGVTWRRPLLVAGAVVIPLMLAGCGTRTQVIAIDGSSTVFPLTAIAAEDFQLATPAVQVKVGASGTGGGFAKFCRGETDANDASREIKPEEADECAANGVEYGRLNLALDAITVVINPKNTWAQCLTVEQLKKIWEPDSSVRNWQDLDPAFPDVPLRLFGPGTDSGTFDYFTKEIVGEEGASRTDFTPSEDDNVIVQGVKGTTGGLGYLGFTYYEQNATVISDVAIDNGEGCVEPTVASAQDGSYAPLSRPLYIYPSVQALARPVVADFFRFYVANDDSIAQAAAYVPLNDEQKQQLKSDLDALLTKAQALSPSPSGQVNE
ncbi:MAG: PstS family phosphate ABC transporter substrate-binding protein [Actinomycetales bacterium]|nr:PstS family phosphate ABC transporter substrate-binding protein [Actinomycetales bacterium]